MSQGECNIFAHTGSHNPMLIVILVHEESTEARGGSGFNTALQLLIKRCKHVAQLEGVQACRGSKEVEIGELIMH